MVDGGYYWVKVNTHKGDEWMIGWYEEDNNSFNFEFNHEYISAKSERIVEIDERRIVRGE